MGSTSLATKMGRESSWICHRSHQSILEVVREGVMNGSIRNQVCARDFLVDRELRAVRNGGNPSPKG